MPNLQLDLNEIFVIDMNQFFFLFSFLVEWWDGERKAESCNLKDFVHNLYVCIYVRMYVCMCVQIKYPVGLRDIKEEL